MKKNIPILSFITRYWMLLILAVVTVALCLNDRIFQMLGALIYIPAACTVAVVVQLLIVHLFFRETIDKDAHDGTYLAEWRALDPRTRIILTVVYRVGILLALSIIAAAVGK